MMRVFAVSGFSGTGKTALVETIVSSMTKAGHTVATIKS
jgi:molybdopterin-guanine dinucleotide biosynthesis protein MobB